MSSGGVGPAEVDDVSRAFVLRPVILDPEAAGSHQLLEALDRSLGPDGHAAARAQGPLCAGESLAAVDEILGSFRRWVGALVEIEDQGVELTVISGLGGARDEDADIEYLQLDPGIIERVF